MYTIGTIGTSKITAHFIHEVNKMDEFRIEMIYSRTKESAERFAQANNVSFFTTDFIKLINCDIVYVASPNSVHKRQVEELIKNRIHIICEKPLTTNATDTKYLFHLAEKYGVVLMEGMRNIHNLHFSNIKQMKLNICQRSSRIDENGKLKDPNSSAFKKSMGGGAVRDMGCYGISLACYFFKKLDVKDVKLNKMINDVDGDVEFTLYDENITIPVRVSKLHQDMYGIINNERYSSVTHFSNTSFIDYMKDFHQMLKGDQDLYNRYRNISIHTAEIIDKI